MPLGIRQSGVYSFKHPLQTLPPFLKTKSQLSKAQVRTEMNLSTWNIINYICNLQSMCKCQQESFPHDDVVSEAMMEKIPCKWSHRIKMRLNTDTDCSLVRSKGTTTPSHFRLGGYAGRGMSAWPRGVSRVVRGVI